MIDADTGEWWRMRGTTRRAAWGAAAVTAAVLVGGCGADTRATVPPQTPVTPAPATVTVTAPAPAATAEPGTPAGGSGSDTGSGAGAGAVPRCTTAELRATLGDGDAGAGSTYRPLLFTNTGGRTCELRGFPGVSYVTGDGGEQVGPAAAESGQRGDQVVLRPGGQAAAVVQFVQVANFDAAVCRPTPVRGLRVYPPGDTAALFVPAEGTGCAGTPPGQQLSVQTVTAR
jgi:Protein of unknown function (DUF4232)